MIIIVEGGNRRISIAIIRNIFFTGSQKNKRKKQRKQEIFPHFEGVGSSKVREKNVWIYVFTPLNYEVAFSLCCAVKYSFLYSLQPTIIPFQWPAALNGSTIYFFEEQQSLPADEYPV